MRTYIFAIVAVASVAAVEFDTTTGVNRFSRFNRFSTGVDRAFDVPRDTVYDVMRTGDFDKMVPTVEGVATTTTVYSMDELIRHPLFQYYMTLPVFRAAIEYPAFQHYVTSPLFQHLWTSEVFQKYFKHPQLFVEYILPQVHVVDSVVGVKSNIFDVNDYYKTIFGGRFGGFGTETTGYPVRSVYDYIFKRPFVTAEQTVVDPIVTGDNVFTGRHHVPTHRVVDDIFGGRHTDDVLLRNIYLNKVMKTLDDIPSSVYKVKTGDFTNTVGLDKNLFNVDTIKYNTPLGKKLLLNKLNKINMIEKEPNTILFNTVEVPKMDETMTKIPLKMDTMKTTLNKEKYTL